MLRIRQYTLLQSWVKWILLGILTLIFSFLGAESILAPLALIIIIGFAIMLVREPRKAFLLIYFTKPIVDATWSVRLPGIGLSLLQISGVMFPIAVALIIYSYRLSVGHLKGYRVFSLFIIMNFITLLTFNLNYIDNASSMAVSSVTIFFQVANGFAAYLVIPFLFDTYEKRRQLFLIFVLAGIFPVLTGMMQVTGIYGGRMYKGVQGLERISAFYHDMHTLRFFSFQSLISVMVYRSMFLDPQSRWYRFQRIALLIYAVVCCIVLYYCYSKALIAILLFGIVAYTIFRNKLVLGPIALGMAIGSYFLVTPVQDLIDKNFFKEISYAEGRLADEHSSTLLSGRVARWEKIIGNSSADPLTLYMIGENYIIGSIAHNDFLRIFYANGAVTLAFYTLMLLIFFWAIVQNEVRYRDALSMASVILFVAYIVDSTGLTPTIYPGYCWFTFSVWNLNLHRIGTPSTQNTYAQAQKTV